MKKILSLVLAMIMVLSMGAVVFADESEMRQATPEEFMQIREELMREQMKQADKSDRFIVKYTTVEAKQGAASTVESAFAKGKLKNQIELQQMEAKIAGFSGREWEELTMIAAARSELSAKSAINMDLKSGLNTKLNVDTRLTEVISLDEAVDPDDFIADFKSSMGSSIEYIQEDIRMEMSAIIETELTIDKVSEVGKTGGANKIVAVIDTGVDVTHPALYSHVVEGYDFVNGTSDVYNANLGSEQNHGTHISGIIAATASNVQIMPLKVFENGTAYTSDIIAAIEYAEANGASVVNCSWGATGHNQALREAMENSSMFFVCAAGNSRLDLSQTPVYPAAFNLPNTISVAAVNQDLGMSYFSNYGSVDIAAKGRDVSSTIVSGGYSPMNGTSMSAAYVSATAALTDSEDIKNVLISSADKLSCLQGKVTGGNYLSVDNLLNGTPGQTLSVNPEDDFDRWVEKTPEESWELFNAAGPTIQIAAGYAHTVALKANGTVFVWGSNSCGQLGDGSSNDKSVPTQVLGMTEITAISAGWSHTVALKSNGNVYAWGYNWNGQVGDGTNVQRYLPVQTCDIGDVKAITAGWEHTVAITETGDVYAWGRNDMGQLGDGSINDGLTPVQTLNISGIQAVSAGAGHTAALKENGLVYTWGRNANGQLGDDSRNDSLTPVQTVNISEVQAVAAGASHTIALKENGDIYAWGDNSSGQLGDGTRSDRNTPVQARDIGDVKAVATGWSHTAAITETGDVYACGSGSDGKLGNGNTNLQLSPVQVINIGEVASIAAGIFHTAALRENGEIYTWGNNDYGQLGIGSFGGIKDTPQFVVGFNTGYDAGYDFGSAVEIQIGQTVQGGIIVPSQSDYYYFDAVSDSYFALTECTDNVQISIYCFNDGVLALSPMSPISYANNNQYYKMIDGSTYLIMVKSNKPCDYTFKVKDEVPDLVFTIKPFKLGMDEEEITHLQTGFIKGEIDIENKSNVSQSVMFLMMLKKMPDSSIENMIAIPKVIAAGTTEIFSGYLDVKDDPYYVIEIMVWDSAAKMNLSYIHIFSRI